jgi:hypothetical protein
VFTFCLGFGTKSGSSGCGWMLGCLDVWTPRWSLCMEDGREISKNAPKPKKRV